MGTVVRHLSTVGTDGVGDNLLVTIFGVIYERALYLRRGGVEVVQRGLVFIVVISYHITVLIHETFEGGGVSLNEYKRIFSLLVEGRIFR